MKITNIRIIEIDNRQRDGQHRYVEISSDSELKGHAGPLDGEYQFRAVLSQLGKFNYHMTSRDINDPALNFSELWSEIYPDHPLNSYENGKDPLTGENVWGFHRTARHTPTAEIITAFSAIDIALWDLRGKASKQPVYELLGGTRDVLPTYISCMFTKTPDDALEQAKSWYDKGFKCHKCFLPFRPADSDGINDNIKIVEALKAGLPADAEIMYDLSRLSDQADDPDVRVQRLKWACDMVKTLDQFGSVWIEEPVSPDDLEGFSAIRNANPTAKISAGEHLYTRWNLKPFLDRGLIDIVQCDPEWCGGISEFIEICKMIKTSYPGVIVMPHGHMILAATQCVASQAEELAPGAEFLYQVIPERTRYLTYQPSPELGIFKMPADFGIGPELDPSKFEFVKEYNG